MRALLIMIERGYDERRTRREKPLYGVIISPKHQCRLIDDEAGAHSKAGIS